VGEHGTGPPLLLLLETPLELPLLLPPEELLHPPELLPLPPELLLHPPELLPETPLELPDEPPELPLPPGPPSPRYSIALPPQPDAARARAKLKPRKGAIGRREVRTTPTKSERRASGNRAGSGGPTVTAGVSR
jgi:hypothetical protein